MGGRGKGVWGSERRRRGLPQGSAALRQGGQGCDASSEFPSKHQEAFLVGLSSSNHDD
jgi:hypothetical protein